MKLERIKEEVKKAYATNKKLEIIGYIDSKGMRHNYVVRLLDIDTGYVTLVQNSLDKLTEVTLDGVADIPEEARWEEESAKLELRMSFKKTLAGTHKARVVADPPVPTKDGYCVYKSEEKQNLIAIMSLQEIENTISGDDTAPIRRSQQPCIAAKQALRKQLPISKYINTLILGADKVTSVKAL